MRTVIKNGHLIDPKQGISQKLDVAFEDGLVAAIGENLTGDEEIDATGLVVAPGLVDIHVHFREPGQESKEDIGSGSRAAAAGGFTTVVQMANTSPPIDDAGKVEFVLRRARETAAIRVYPTATATKGMQGVEMTEMAELKRVGAVAVTDDGKDIESSLVLRRVLEYANMCGLLYMAHCEDIVLADGGSINEGFTSTRLGIPGIPAAAEEIRIGRNARLAELAGARIHIQHVTSKVGVDICRAAKARGVRLTCESAPHYWMLTDEAVAIHGPNAKMNPPLRTDEDRLAVIQGFKEGVFDCIATDHAPHTPTEKDAEVEDAPFGIIGIETSLPLAITGLVEPGHLTLERVIDLMTWSGARILDLPAGYLEEGGPADIVLFDPKETWIIDPEQSLSKSRNTPFKGQAVTGRIKRTICAGKTVFEGG